jgi:hypothetical protein
MDAISGTVMGLGVLVGVGLAFLVIGDRWAKHAPSEHGDFFPTLHLLALAAAIVGIAVAWMGFASDHPKKWLHLSMPFVLVAIVYGYALKLNPTNWLLLRRDIRDRFKRKDAV